MQFADSFFFFLFLYLCRCRVARIPSHRGVGRAFSVTHSAARDRESSLRSFPVRSTICQMETYVDWLFVATPLAAVTAVFAAISRCLLFAHVLLSYMSHRRSVFHFPWKILPWNYLETSSHLILFLLFLPNYHYYYCRLGTTLISVYDDDNQPSRWVPSL